MATKKQRRRRDKDRRHEWEFVYVDEEGHEVEADEEDASPPSKPQKDGQATKRPLTTRGGRRVEPPSWQRVFRRALIFAPLMIVVVYLLKPKNGSTAGVVAQALILIALFIPFSYLMDSLMYRSFRKRMGGDGPQKRR